jgi:YVTN family beta-propeller protein
MKHALLYAFMGLWSLSALSQNLVDLNVIGTYQTGRFDESAMEIVAYDAANQLLYAVNADAETIDVIDITNPTNPVRIDSIDVSNYGDAPNSVAFSNGVLAVAVEADDFDAPGQAVFFDDQRNFLAAVEVGVLPDMITFTPDGSKAIVANEGEPDDDYTADPMGSVSIIDLSGGAANLSQANVTTLDFTGFDANYPANVRNFGPVANFFEDFESTADSLDNLIFVMTAGSQSWAYDDFSGDHFAEANAFSSSGPTVGWLITPAQNLTGLDSAYFSFYSAKNFSGGRFDVLVSTDYNEAVNTDPATATWDTITSQFALSPGGYTDTFSGKFSLENYLSDRVSVAFYYRGGPGGGNSTLWQIDDIRFEGTQPRLSQNLEPEYVAVSPDNATAYVVCQENNTVAVVDLTANSITALIPLGFKDWSTGNNRMDASNRSSGINIRNWPVFGMYQPDAMKAFEVGGTVYLATANEGDARDYDAYSEEERVEDLTLDPTAFPNAANLQMEDSLGRLLITTSLGDTDGDGDFDELYSYGARSFSIWNATTGALVWDSEDGIAQVLATDYPNEFNSNNDDNSSLKSRSDDKGSEPEAIEIAEINGKVIAFVGLERMGGVMVYDITDPTAPTFVSYYLNRDFSVAADDPNAGDLGPEDIKFISAADSPNGSPMLAVANEVSGTLSLYAITGTIGLTEQEREKTLQVYPNPTNGLVNLSRAVEGAVLFNLQGQRVKEVSGLEIDMSNLPAGVYTLKVDAANSLQILKR